MIIEKKPPRACHITQVNAREVCGGHLAAPPSSTPIRLLAILACGALLAAMPAQAAWNIRAQTPEPRVDDGATFEVVSPAFEFVVDSSLDDNKWWASDEPSPWESVLVAPDSGEHLGMRVDEAIPAGGSFWFGMSSEYRMTDLIHAFRIRYGEDGLAIPPNGTEFYLGYTNVGTPSGVNWEDHGKTQGNPAPENLEVTVDNILVAPNNTAPPPDSAFPAGFAGYYSWIRAVQLDQGAGSTKLIISTTGTGIQITEMVFVVVLPDNQGMTLAANLDDRLHFSWTLDSKTTLGTANPNFGTVIIPEPTRVILLGMAFALLVLRRSR